MKPELIAFFSLSALAHAAVLGTYHAWPINISENNEQGSSSLNIVIVSNKAGELPDKPNEPQQVSENIITTKAESHKVLAKIPTKSHTGTSGRQTELNKPLTPSSDTPNNKLVESAPNSSNNENREKISTLLKEAFSKHFYYPKAALRRNWQGDLILAFRITGDGIIEDIIIEKSSGHSILDNAAINSIKQVKIENQIMTLVSNQSFTQSLPISYQLIH